VYLLDLETVADRL